MNGQTISQVIVPMQQTPSMIGGYVKGMTKVYDLQSFAHKIVCDHACYNDDVEQYDLAVSDLPDFIRHEFAAKIMSFDSDYANEANGADNAAYESTMLPALLKFLKNSTDRDLEIQFTNAWRDGVTSYMADKMQELIDVALVEYNDSGSFYD